MPISPGSRPSTRIIPPAETSCLTFVRNVSAPALSAAHAPEPGASRSDASKWRVAAALHNRLANIGHPLPRHGTSWPGLRRRLLSNPPTVLMVLDDKP